jgi:UDP-N-acetylmuramoyl-L-alanyl-D-glutamate--2,6-diaminopimelate ligase
MNISELLSGITPTEINIEVEGLCLNTENAHAGDLFVALRGDNSHGMKYIDSAVNKGCVAVLVDSEDIECAIPSIRIDNLAKYMEQLVSTFYSNAKKVKIIGITGTNGKTSVGYFISQLLSELGVKNGFIGTLGISSSDDIDIHSSNTTPDITTLYRTLEKYYLEEIHTAVVEVSSHSLAQNRVSGLNFIQAIFTNLTQDHLDYHKTIEQYRDAKAGLFNLDSLESVIINKDDDNYPFFLEKSKGKKITTFSINDFQSAESNSQGFLCRLDDFVFEISLLGGFNLSNILASLNSVEQLGYERDKIIPLLPKLLPPTGRLQQINKLLVWVDYAHTPDAIYNAITTLKEHFPNHKVRIVFGCGGNRDKTKRAKMGKIASKHADTIILTNDNPRNEDPSAIIDDIKSGIDDSIDLDIILDRKLAIETAVTTLMDDECLLIAGKGHESTQQFRDRIIEINDIDIAKNAAL